MITRRGLFALAGAILLPRRAGSRPKALQVFYREEKDFMVIEPRFGPLLSVGDRITIEGLGTYLITDTASSNDATPLSRV